MTFPRSPSSRASARKDPSFEREPQTEVSRAFGHPHIVKRPRYVVILRKGRSRTDGIRLLNEPSEADQVA